ncbi:MAG: hypothetical protein IPP57_13910 [Candidatus Obscuribacter sp.]|nr:hypothetical protein [Candidatus Obscuribacter sp.]
MRHWRRALLRLAAFKQTINTGAGNAVSGATKASEKLRAEQLTSRADVKKQLTAVATIRAPPKPPSVTSRPPRLVVKLTGDFKMAAEAKASRRRHRRCRREGRRALGADVVKKQQAAATAHTSRSKPVKALDTAREPEPVRRQDRRDRAHRRDDRGPQHRRRHLAGAQGPLTTASPAPAAAASQAQKDLDTAQARLDLSQGSDTDREIAEISQAAARKAAREQLEAELGMTKPAAAPAAPSEQK